MFFDRIDEIAHIIKHVGTAVFVVPSTMEFTLNQAFYLKPEQKSVITLDQVKDVLSKLNTKQLVDQYIIIRPAELLDTEAANALLKNLEEPKPKVHFILMTAAPSLIIPTILSRAQVYFYRSEDNSKAEIQASQEIKELAKQLLVAKGAALVALAEQIARKKDREYALQVVGVAIEMLYKAYFLKNKVIFIKKLPKFLDLYTKIAQNGHVKLQIVANLC